LVKKNGSKFPSEVSAVLFNDSENRERIGWLFREMTEQKRIEANLKFIIEKTEEEDHLKKTFLQNILHEIRNPITAILGF
jgi:signal transduction histidine kinase